MYKSDDETTVAKYLKGFDEIVVREEELANKLSALLNRKVDCVCDPTMLIDPKIWGSYLKQNNQEDYCLMYFDDNEGNVSKAIKEYAEQNNIDAKKIGYDFWIINRAGCENMEVYTITDFLSAIANTKMLFTASYHGMLFAVYFHVPFIYYNKDSYRLEMVAKKLGLEGRNGNKYGVNQMKEIDWQQVDEKREHFRTYSLEILKSMLKV
ncbi:MAG: polysaccharide pyruvyl transferase family protein [Butyrivibrio sp.]|nr:polysaccharide pyruvyl transferase family protein [Butyrivibrio sp.]